VVNGVDQYGREISSLFTSMRYLDKVGQRRRRSALASGQNSVSSAAKTLTNKVASTPLSDAVAYRTQTQL
jgi:hypothetical protein